MAKHCSLPCLRGTLRFSHLFFDEYCDNRDETLLTSLPEGDPKVFSPSSLTVNGVSIRGILSITKIVTKHCSPPCLRETQRFSSLLVWLLLGSILWYFGKTICDKTLLTSLPEGAWGRPPCFPPFYCWCRFWRCLANMLMGENVEVISGNSGKTKITST